MFRNVLKYEKGFRVLQISSRFSVVLQKSQTLQLKYKDIVFLLLLVSNMDFKLFKTNVQIIKTFF